MEQRIELQSVQQNVQMFTTETLIDSLAAKIYPSRMIKTPDGPAIEHTVDPLAGIFVGEIAEEVVTRVPSLLPDEKILFTKQVESLKYGVEERGIETVRIYSQLIRAFED